MDSDASGSGGWRFAQCFGDKGDVEDITEGWLILLHAFLRHTLAFLSASAIYSRHHFDC